LRDLGECRFLSHWDSEGVTAHFGTNCPDE
jgi:hypothetical protein